MGFLHVLFGHATLLHGAIVGEHLQGGGQIIVHKLADLGRLSRLLRHGAEDLHTLLRKLIHLLGKCLIRDGIILCTDLSEHFLPLGNNPVRNFIPSEGQLFHVLLQGIGRLILPVMGGQIQVCGHNRHHLAYQQGKSCTDQNAR